MYDRSNLVAEYPPEALSTNITRSRTRPEYPRTVLQRSKTAKTAEVPGVSGDICIQDEGSLRSPGVGGACSDGACRASPVNFGAAQVSGSFHHTAHLVASNQSERLHLGWNDHWKLDVSYTPSLGLSETFQHPTIRTTRQGLLRLSKMSKSELKEYSF